MSSLSMARFKDTNNVLALAFGVLIVAMVMAGSLSIRAHLNADMIESGGAKTTPAQNTLQQLVVTTHGSMLPSDCVFART